MLPDYELCKDILQTLNQYRPALLTRSQLLTLLHNKKNVSDNIQYLQDSQLVEMTLFQETDAESAYGEPVKENIKITPYGIDVIHELFTCQDE